eukprot:TRINITY_DN1249_c0_g1_i1.p1 TRINITY_DN1249_c0_g1~~TRINITY_DN1249_c0_g1_i1.p1  ORF type:complete len:2848 (+),score=450.11 TRINITY_DN1249_c0_g1_i1:2019-10562(+)
MHLAERFRVPTFVHASTSQDLSLSVTTLSLLRLTMQSQLDVSVSVTEASGSRSVLTTVQDIKGELVVTLSLPLGDYVITITYSDNDWRDHGAVCFTSLIEIGVVPQNAVSAALCAQKIIPPVTWLSSLNSTTTTLQFNQDSSELRLVFPFRVLKSTAFRASVMSSFLLGDVTLRLRSNHTSLLLPASHHYNRNDIAVVDLSPSDYVLEVLTTAVWPDTFRTCVVAYVQVQFLILDAAAVMNRPCTTMPLPQAFNSPALMSPASGQAMHLAGNFLLDVVKRSDGREFTITTLSVFRLFVEDHTAVDVDVKLFPGTKAQHDSSIVSGTGFSGEAVGTIVVPGSYFLQLTYYGRDHFPLPDAATCPSVYIELAIRPLADLKSSTNCSSSFPATDKLEPISGVQYARSMWDRFDFRSVNSTFSSPFAFELAVGYDFAVTGLVAQLVSTDGLTRYPATSVKNQQLLRVGVPAGTYALLIQDPFPLSLSMQLASNGIGCSSYSVSLALSQVAMSDSDCLAIHKLPLDAFSDASGQFGGPQDPVTGQLWLYGDSFEFPTATVRSLDSIDFKIFKPSLLRLFARFPADADADFFLYRMNNGTASDLLDYSLSGDSMESMLIALPDDETLSIPTGGIAYQLVVYYYTVPAGMACAHYTFEMAIDTVDSVKAQHICSHVSASLPSSVRLTSDAPISLFGENYQFTNRQIRNQTQGGIFRYVIPLIVTEGNATVQAFIGFNFLANNFRLMIVDSQETTVASGISAALADRDAHINFQNTLTGILVSGRYSLHVMDDSLADGDFDVVGESYCHKFTFSLQASTTRDQLPPTIVGVVPPGGYLDASRDVTITIIFSEPIAVPRSFSSFSHHIALVSPNADVSDISPSEVRVLQQNTQLSCVFQVHTASIFRLQLNASAFHTPSNSPFVTALDGEHAPQYSTISCNCHDHGLCTANGTCICQPPYAGPSCLQCIQGYHSAATECVQNVPCAAESCSGHGICDDTAGYPVCRCYDAYATVGFAVCGSCSPSAFGIYPNCTMQGDDNPTDNWCTAARLPSTLNVPGMLAYDNTAYLQDMYFVDLDHPSHNVEFELLVESVLRIYVEPHKIDIDVWLNLVRQDGTLKRIDSGITIGEEEVIFQVLPAGSYLVQFLYYNWVHDSTACQTFNLDFAIAPLTTVASIGKAVVEVCSADVLPNIGNFSLETPDVIPEVGFRFGSSDASAADYKVYCVMAPAKPPTDDLAIFVWNYVFRTKNIAHKEAVLHAQIGDKFLLGDVALLLEQGSADHCGKRSSRHGKCVTGQNSANHQVIERALLPDTTYSLWIYQPIPQNKSLSPAAPFDFSISIDYTTVDEDVFECQATRLPITLNTAAYLGTPNSHFLHVFDKFMVDFAIRVHTMQFEIEVESFVRVFTPAHYVDIDISLMNEVTKQMLDTSVSLNQEDMVFSRIPPGKYSLIFRFYVSHLLDTTQLYCEVFDMELAVVPVSRAYSTLSGSCPSVLPVLPAIPEIVRTPFVFETTSTTKAFYAKLGSAHNPTEVARFQIVLLDNALLSVGLSSDFATTGLSLRLTNHEYNEIIYGRHQKNYNYLQETLQSGNYTLAILQPRNSNASCGEFNLFVSLHNVDPSAVGVTCGNQPVPVQLNTIRYLGGNGRVHLQSDNFAIPKQFYSTHVMAFLVHEPSLLHVYVEPHAVDIDLHLYNNGSSRDAASLIARGISFNEEESFSLLVSPGFSYEMEFSYFHWNGAAQKCESYNMEFALAPVSDLTMSQLHCMNGGDHLPSLPTNFDHLPFSYSSTAIAEALYIQQNAEAARTINIPFTIAADVNLFISLGYSFLYGDLAMKLQLSNHTLLALGRNQQDRHTLIVRDLKPGSYNIQIYEPVQTIETQLHCIAFTFAMEMESAKDAVDESRTLQQLPANLNDVANLMFEQRAYLQGQFALPIAPASTQSIKFALTEATMFRVYVEPHAVDIDLHLYNITSSRVQIGRSIKLYEEDSIAMQLTGGRYELMISVIQSWKGVQSPFYSMQLALAPVGTLPAPVLDCSDLPPPPFVLNPSTQRGELHGNAFILSATRSQNATLLQMPFTLIQPAVVYAVVTYPFLMADLSVRAVSSTTLFDNSPLGHTLVGVKRRNWDEIMQVFQPGEYLLELYQPVFPRAALCIPYSLSVHVAPVNGHSDHVCTGNVLPFDLNDKLGGSQPFGGPIAQNSITLFGDDFLIPRGVDYETMSFAIDRISLLRVLVETTSSSTIATVSLADVHGMMVMPDQSVQLAISHSVMYELRPGNYTVQIKYERVDRFVACPSFELYMKLQPRQRELLHLTCADNSDGDMPALITVDTSGFASQYLMSFMTSQQLTSMFSAGGVSLPFRVSKITHIASSITFDSLASFFILELEDTSCVNCRRFLSSPLTDSETGDMDAMDMIQQLNTVVSSGSYILHIKPNSVSWFAERICAPYIFDLQIVPSDSHGYVREILPSGSANLDVDQPLRISLFLSSPVFDVNHNAATASLVKSAYRLGNEAHSVIAAESAIGSDDQLHWTLQFSGLERGHAYTLQLVPGLLYDDQFRSFELHSTPRFVTIQAICSGRGHPVNGLCVCDDGFAGSNCQLCAPGYNTVTDPGTTTVASCQPIASWWCHTDSTPCGCVGIASTCVPRGQCVDRVTAPHVCLCNAPYNGTRCQDCVAGFYPSLNGTCELMKTCGPCYSGTCDFTTGLCICSTTFQGVDCSQCRPGFSGPLCTPVASFEEYFRPLRIVGGVIAILFLTSVGAMVVYRFKSRTATRAHARGQGHNYDILYPTEEQQLPAEEIIATVTIARESDAPLPEPVVHRAIDSANSESKPSRRARRGVLKLPPPPSRKPVKPADSTIHNEL